MEHLECDICGTVSLHGRYVVLSPWRSKVTVRYCDVCEFYYLSQRPSASELSEHYKKYYSMSAASRFVKYFIHRERLAYQASYIRDAMSGFVAEEGLEVGSPDGGLIKRIPVVGNRYAIDYSLDHDVVNRGVVCLAGWDGLSNRSFDLVVASHVVEHFLDPVDELRRLVGIINKSGYIYIEVPLSPAYDDDFKKIQRYLNTDHIVNFTMSSIRNMLALFPDVEIVDMRLYELNLAGLSFSYRQEIAQLITEGVGDPRKKAKALFKVVRMIWGDGLFRKSSDDCFVFGKNIQLLARKKC